MSDGRIQLLPAPTRPVFYSCGTTLLDCALGGGLPVGRVTNVIGDKSVGKTLFAIEAAANFVRKFPEGQVFYKEREGAFDRDYARTVGLPEERLELDEDIATTEAFWHFTEDEIKKDTKQERLIILDSLDSLSDEKEMKRDVGDASYGMAKGKLMSEGFRKTAAPMRQMNISMIIVSQIRDKTNAMPFGKQVERAGGHALDFYASQCLWLYEKGKIKKKIGDLERIIGIDVWARVEKNKVGWPWRDCDFPMIFGYGVDDIKAGLKWLSIASPATLKEIVPEMTKENYLRHITKVDRNSFNEILIRTWEEVDKQFRPTTTKYGNLTPLES